MATRTNMRRVPDPDRTATTQGDHAGLHDDAPIPPPDPGSFRLVGLEHLVESGHNPRTYFDDVRLQELAASIRQKGVLEPLVVRQVDAGSHHPMAFEIVAGARRYRASKIAGLAELPCMVHLYTDLQALEAMTIENDQREDVHPLEQARGYQALLQAESTYTVESIAAKVGKDVSTIRRRLRLLGLIPDAQEAFLKGEIELGHADRLSRLTASDQPKALRACFEERFDYSSGVSGARVKHLAPVHRLEAFIRDEVRLPLDPSAPALEPFPELRAELAKAQTADAPRLIELTEEWRSPGEKPKPGAPLPRSTWEQIDGKKACAHAQRGVVVLGAQQGRIITFCAGRGVCKAHWGHTVAQPKSSGSGQAAPADTSYHRQERARQQKVRAWGQVKRLALEQVETVAPKTLTTAALQVLSAAIGGVGGRPKTVTIGSVLRQAAEKLAWDEVQFTAKVAKPLGINLKALHAQVKKPKTPAKKKAVAKTKVVATSKGGATAKKKSVAA